MRHKFHKKNNKKRSKSERFPIGRSDIYTHLDLIKEKLNKKEGTQKREEN